MKIDTHKNLVCMLVVAFVITGVPIVAEAVTEIVATGKFEGRSDHEVSGGVTLLKTDQGYVVLLEADFSLDKAPSPTLGFGSNGYKADTKFSKLNSKKGLQAYKIPGEINPAAFTEIWVWCKKFDVPLGMAKLKKAP